jgi:hypothetical protein
MVQATTSRPSSTLSSPKEIEGYPSLLLEIWTVEVEDDEGIWRVYDAGQKAGPPFFVRAIPAQALARKLLGVDPERGVRMVRWYRLVTTERI